MGLLILASAFFSSSEAAWFYLRGPDRRKLARGNRAQRLAISLLDDPDRLLTAVLFWNLVVNLAYFTIVSIVGLRLQDDGRAAAAWWFAVVALMVMIVMSEMLPKSLGVLKPKALATLFAVPLSVMVRLVDPALPVFRTVLLLSRRLFWPGFAPEPYLAVGDLERAVELSTTDAALLEREQVILQRIVLLSEIRADELMRPRTQCLTFAPPVSLAHLGGRMTPSGYLLVTESDGDEVAAAIDLASLSSVPETNLENHAEPVVFVPWCSSVAVTLETMHQRDCKVAAIVNELGETIGILTFDDILDTVFTRSPSRSQRLLKRAPIRRAADGVWRVTGMTSLRRLTRYFKNPRPASKSLTVAGVIQETLHQFPREGDVCRWGPYQFKVIEISDRGQLTVEVTLPEGEGGNA
jgi:CBS domain containing-hemolysin-like protein